MLDSLNQPYASGGYQITDGETEEHDARGELVGPLRHRPRWAIKSLDGITATGRRR
ncbi:MAG: hypothetical protein ACR2KL_07985 [Nocardioidaceae bacterium]